MNTTTSTLETKKSSVLLKSKSRLTKEKIKILKDLTSNFRDKTVTHVLTGTDILRAMRDGNSINKDKTNE